MDELTRNESADLAQKIWATVVEQTPQSTKDLRMLGSVYHMTTCDTSGMHQDHYKWLVKALDDDDVLDAIDELAELARAAGGEVEGLWRDG